MPTCTVAYLQDVLRLYAFSTLLQLLLLIPYLLKVRHFGQSPTAAVHKALDLLVHAAPPALPATMLLCGLATSFRLKKQGMRLLFMEVLKLAADTEVVCFDKTGTLTGSVVSLPAESSRHNLPPPVSWLSDRPFHLFLFVVSQLQQCHVILPAMAVMLYVLPVGMCEHLRHLLGCLSDVNKQAPALVQLLFSTTCLSRIQKLENQK